ncbi:RNA polymerase-binding protein DksA [Buchnera aphidicola (Neophyllaphis podocarpi)]|uniref:RNA polymerase-binding protein DksA n=1 Tax=Buchnera aphidicola TaxID=9 RepID=UPI0031B87FDC
MKKQRNNKSSILSILNIAGVKPYKQINGEEYMSKLQITHFKKILKAWDNKIKKESSSALSYIKNESINFPDPVDRAVQEEEFSIEIRNRDRERKLLKKIKYTLKKIKENNFGFCELCGVKIGIRRLEAHPTADLCIDCKTLEEIKKKQING